MKRLAPLFTLLLASLCLAATAKALPLPTPHPLPSPFSFDAEEIEASWSDEDEGEEEGEGEEAELCEPDEDESCEEEVGEGDECVIESADAAVSAGHDKVRVRLRYTASEPATFVLAYSLLGKGNVQIGTARAQLHRSGVFHDSISLAGKKLEKLRSAHELAVELQAVGSPSYCRERFTAAPHRAK